MAAPTRLDPVNFDGGRCEVGVTSSTRTLPLRRAGSLLGGKAEGWDWPHYFPLNQPEEGVFFSSFFSEQQSRDPLCWRRAHKEEKRKEKTKN